MRFTATLIGDGRSDRTLIHIIQLILDELSPFAYAIYFAENLTKNSLESRIFEALQMYPCDLLFVHRDAESQSTRQREIEIEQAMEAISDGPSFISIIPVRMTEAWLLLHEQAIRTASSNPNGRTPLNLPPIKKIESLSDPKDLLFQALRIASEQSAQRRAKFDVHRARHRVSELLTKDDLACLREIPSFQHFESQVRHYFQNFNRA